MDIEDPRVREAIRCIIHEALVEERRRIANRIRNMDVYSTLQASSDPMNPFGAGSVVSEEDIRMFRTDIANAIEGDE